MSNTIKKNYYKLNQKDFNDYLNSLKDDPFTLHFFNEYKENYFYLSNFYTNKEIIEINVNQQLFDNTLKSFSIFAQKQIIQAYLIEEIEATNKIENIYSTKHDIFYLINKLFNSKNNNLVSIVKTYEALLKHKYAIPLNHKDIIKIYDDLLKDMISDKDKLDGKYYRKDHVYISDGIKNVHKGFYPEEIIETSMKEFIDLNNNKNLNIYERSLLSHFLIETIHPFYDGNGRVGRFLLSLNIFNNTNSYISLIISKIINENKNKYYKLLKEARDYNNFGCLNDYLIEFTKILNDGIKQEINHLLEKRLDLEEFKISKQYSKAEIKIINLLKEASLFSDFGITNDEIIEYTELSRRTVVSTLKKLNNDNLLNNTKISKTYYHKLSK